MILQYLLSSILLFIMQASRSVADVFRYVYASLHAYSDLTEYSLYIYLLN